MAAHTICLVGNPNCGKTTLFNALTGARQQVGNWPGVTVERKTGSYQGGGGEVAVVDLPGVYSLAVTSVSSLDERIAREFVLSGEADLIVNILDASNLERNLYLTTQLLEMRVPMLVALNMVDVARDRRIRSDAAALAARLGCPVVPIVASRGDGVPHLRAAIDRTAGERRVPKVDLGYSAEIEQSLAELTPLLEGVAVSPPADGRWLAIKLLEGDEGALAMVPDRIREAAGRIAGQAGDRADEDCDILIADSRYGFAHALIREAVRREGVVRRTVSDRVDRVVLHRLAGIPIFLAVMYLLFLFTIDFGSAFIDFFDQFAGTLLVDGTAHLLDGLGSPPWLTALLADGVGGGVQTVATFIPIISCLYLFLSALEDSGYMARAAFVMDRLMRSVGLPGKSFIPLIVGFGCNVPAIMATRTLENRRDRIMTVMMAPFMSCGARLPVYALFAAAMFPTGGQNLVFALYLIGIAFAVMTGLVLKKTLLKGETTPFVMELPPYHLADAAGHPAAHLGAVAGVPVSGRPGDRRRRRRAELLQQLGYRRLVRQPGHRSLGARRRRQVDHARSGADGHRRGQLAGDGRHAHRHLRQGDGGRNAERAVRLAGRGRGGGGCGGGIVRPVGRHPGGVRHHPGQPRRIGGSRRRPARAEHRRDRRPAGGG